MPQALLDHLRYPEDLFNIQAEVYSTYHVDNADVLYNKGDQWAIPDNVSLSGAGPHGGLLRDHEAARAPPRRSSCSCCRSCRTAART